MRGLTMGTVRQDRAHDSRSVALITGAGGFIGRHCLAPLTKSFGQVHAVSRSSRPGRVEGVVPHVLDLFDAPAVQALVTRVRPTHLLHLAWTTEPGRYWNSVDNLRWVEASLQLARAFVATGGRRLVTAGSCAEYQWLGGHCQERTTPLEPATLYGRSKHALRLMLESFAALEQVSYASTRIFFGFGPHEQPQRLTPSLIQALLAGRRAACSEGRQRRDFLHVADIAAAHVQLLASDVEGAVNIGSGKAVAVREMAETIGALLGRSELIDFGALPMRAAEPDMLVADTTRLEQELGFTPHYDLAAGLADTIAWWQAQGPSDAGRPLVAGASTAL